MKPLLPQPEFDSLWVEQRYGARFQAFQNLMTWRIRDVLLVSSLYDLYLFEEDGRLYELIRNEYKELYLTHSPELTRVSTGKEALDLVQVENRFDLIITTLHIDDMPALKFARLVREAGINIPIVLLAYDNSELKNLPVNHDGSIFDRVFIWQGDFRLMVAIIKHLEDKNNVEHDTKAIGVQSIILIEDNIQFYSSFLPIVYSEVLKQSQRLLVESVSRTDRSVRMRARPKILLTSSYEEAWKYYQQFEECVLGIISDIDFIHGGNTDPGAGIEFARNVRAQRPDIPILLQSTTAVFEEQARRMGCGFLLKDSPLLLNEVREFIVQHFGFGDFVFRTGNGSEVARAADLKMLEEQLHEVPDECILYHAERNHFSTWLKARTEFGLARELRPRKVSDYESVAKLREHLIFSLREYRRLRQGGMVMTFTRETYIPSVSLARIGGGSLGGKARGLGFVNILMNAYDVRERFPGVRIAIPPGIILGADVFDRFMDENNLRPYALSETDDQAIVRRFLATGPFPRRVMVDLAAFLDLTPFPLAVRSSSLLEDSQYHPFAGVYATFMLANNHKSRRVRLQHLVQTIKRVYASTYCRAAKEYVRMTSVRLEEEKMAVIIQKTVGSVHGRKFYPHFSGVARSYNYYPMPPQESKDGIVSIALGLGKTVAEGGKSLRFSPRYPNHIIQLSTPEEALANNQTEFYALSLDDKTAPEESMEDSNVLSLPVSVAEEDGALQHLASTYSHENDMITDGLSRSGTRIITFSSILRQGTFPLCDVLETLLKIGSGGMGTPVEMEFAVNLSAENSEPSEFGLLQIRPLALTYGVDDLDIESVDPSEILCSSKQVLGNGVMTDIFDVVLVDRERFDRTRTHDVAREVNALNESLLQQQRPYLLIGIGRWGSIDPWLGIPVKWEQISGARAIVESGFKDIDVAPSQGSHFFQNITSFQTGYFSVNPMAAQGFIDWDWLLSQRVTRQQTFTRHLRFAQPVIVKINGHTHEGLILKPERKRNER